MYNHNNFFIINNKEMKVKKIELNKNDLYIEDITGIYSLCIHIYNWKEINQIEIGKQQNIEFNEYCLSENNESALIWPTKSYIIKPTKDTIIFNLKFDDFSDACYMNKRNCFDIKLESIYVQATFDYHDAKDGSITYNL